MATFQIDADVHKVRGRYNIKHPPILTVDSGDVVRFKTADVTWGLSQHTVTVDDTNGISNRRYLSVGARTTIEPRDLSAEGGPAMCGPVEIRGAEPGMVLAVHLNTIVPDSWGWTWTGPGHLDSGRLPSLGLDTQTWGLMCWEIDAELQFATNRDGLQIPISPFMGTIGVAPGAPGDHDGWTPRRTGGNLDCKALVAGSTLFFPIEAHGARFYIGDGHARQGDGEISGAALECPMTCVEVRFELIETMEIDGPVAHTPEGWVTIGLDHDLDRAWRAAMLAMLTLIERHLGVSRVDALSIASVAVDLRLTQLVNGVRGVHAILSKDIRLT